MPATKLSSPLLIDRPVEGVARLRLNRPHVRNALNTELRRALAEALQNLDTDASVRCAVICGSGSHFASGADINEIMAFGPIDVWQQQTAQYWKRIAEFSKPLIAAVSGMALGGGCELALHADIIIASRSARLGQPEVGVGIMPGGGATQRLMRAVGKYRAMLLLLTGESVGAQEALAMGMVSEVVDDDKLEERTLQIASLLATRPPLSLRLIKEVALAGSDAPLATGLLLERRAFELLFDTADQKEGMRAFIERRDPVFIGE
jgi:enoyl-CoA hydratase